MLSEEARLKLHEAQLKGDCFHWKITHPDEKIYFLIQTLMEKKFVYHGEGEILRKSYYGSPTTRGLVEKRIITYCGDPFSYFPMLCIPTHHPDLMFSRDQYWLGRYYGEDEFWYSENYALLGDHFFWGDKDIIDLLKTKNLETGDLS